MYIREIIFSLCERRYPDFFSEIVCYFCSIAFNSFLKKINSEFACLWDMRHPEFYVKLFARGCSKGDWGVFQSFFFYVESIHVLLVIHRSSISWILRDIVCFCCRTVWKSRQNHDHSFYGKTKIFSVKSTFYDFTEEVTKLLISRKVLLVIAFKVLFYPHTVLHKHNVKIITLNRKIFVKPISTST